MVYNSLMLQQFRVYPTNKQKRAIDEQLKIHCKLYNDVREFHQKSYTDNKNSVRIYDLVKLFCPALTGTTNSTSAQQTVLRFGKGYRYFIQSYKNKSTSI